MAISPNYISIGELFQRNVIFRVPRYQRGYSWEETELQDFLRDIEKCYLARVKGGSRHHFFGGIVSVKRDVPGSAGRHSDLIDGQQRIATFVILANCLERIYLALADEAKRNADPSNESLARTRARLLRRQYLEFEDEVNRKPTKGDRLVLSAPDSRFFEDLIHGQAPTPQDRKSHQRIEQAHTIIHSKLAELLAQHRSISNKLEVLATFRDVLLEDATVIDILTEQEAEAYRIFQVLNDRGTRLSEGDLLRASTLEMLGTPKFTADHETAAEMWDDILKDDPKHTGNFLRWYFASVKGKRPGQSSLFDDFFDELFPEHERRPLSKKSARAVVTTIQNLRDEARNCRMIIEGEWPYSEPKARLWDRDRLALLVRDLGHTNCMPLLLAASQLPEGKFAQIVHLTERFAFRYKFASNLHIGSLTNVYHQQAIEIRSNPRKYRVERLRQEFSRLQAAKATDSLFGAWLDQVLYQPDSGNKELKYLLATLEHYWEWFERGVAGAPKCMDTTRIFDFRTLTIEHIYPQNAPAAMRDSALEPLVNSLGNVTFLGPETNDRIGNKEFAAKRTILQQSSIFMNRDIANEVAWTATAVRARQQKLKDLALKVFRI